MAVVDLSAFASVEPNLDAGLGLDLVQISWQGIVNVFAHVFGDVAAEAFVVQLVSKPSVDTKLAFQPMCDNSPNLHFVALGLEILDQINCGVAIS